jgi:Amt family ammonium transporter
VHIAAGLSGLAAVLALRKRAGYPKKPMNPSSTVLTLVGAGLLWFGWFGFNGGSALAANGLAGAAVAASQVAAAAGALGWMMAEWKYKGKPTALGLASGLVAGLVAVTPAAGFVPPLGAVAIGLASGVCCYGAVRLKTILGYDDSLDAFGVHGVGGFLGAIATGVFASAIYYKAGAGSSLPADGQGGWWYDGNAGQALVQLAAALVAVVFSFTVSWVLIKGIDLAWGFCVDPNDEIEGLDQAEHGETGFEFGLGTEAISDRKDRRILKRMAFREISEKRRERACDPVVEA